MSVAIHHNISDLSGQLSGMAMVKVKEGCCQSLIVQHRKADPTHSRDGASKQARFCVLRLVGWTCTESLTITHLILAFIPKLIQASVDSVKTPDRRLNFRFALTLSCFITERGGTSPIQTDSALLHASNVREMSRPALVTVCGLMSVESFLVCSSEVWAEEVCWFA